MQIAAVIEVVGWTAQLITHGFYEVSVCYLLNVLASSDFFLCYL